MDTFYKMTYVQLYVYSMNTVSQLVNFSNELKIESNVFTLEGSRKVKPLLEHLEVELAEASDKRQFCFESLSGFHPAHLEKLEKKKLRFPLPSYLEHIKTA